MFLNTNVKAFSDSFDSDNDRIIFKINIICKNLPHTNPNMAVISSPLLSSLRASRGILIPMPF